MVHEKISDARKALFEVLVKQKGQKPILFERIESEPIAYKSSGGGSESPLFFHYGKKSRHMMERMGYNLTKGSGLNFDKGKRALLRSFVPKGKDPDHYHQTWRELDYVSILVSSDSRYEEEVYHDSSSATSPWDSDVSVGVIFENLSVNIVSASHLEADGEDSFKSKELIQSNSDPWIKYLNTL